MKENQLVSEKERKEMPFKVLEGYRNLKIVDVEKVAKQIQEERRANHQSMEIHLLPVRENKVIDPNTKVTFCKDISTDIYYGIVVNVYDDGNPRWRPIMINEHLDLNLNNFDDCKAWVILRMHPYVQGSPMVKEDPLLKVFDTEFEAIKNINKGKEMAKAIARVEMLKGESLIAFARGLGILITQTTSLSELQGNITSQAMENPIVFNEKWDAGDRNVIELFESAAMLDVVKLDQQKGYFFESIPLGINKPAAINYLKTNSDIFISIGQQVKSKDKDGERIIATEEKKEEKEPIKVVKKETIKA